MKKIISLLFAIIFCFASAVPAMAESDYDAEKANLQSQWSIDISCIYDESQDTITYNGTVPYDLSKAYRDHTVNLYKLSSTQSADELRTNPDIVPIAASGMSIKLHFSVDVESISDVFSKYAVAFVSSDGTLDYVSEAVFPAVESDFSRANGAKENFKGIDMSADTSSLKASPSLAVIDIEIDKMYGRESMGYLYTLEGDSVFFSKEYIDELDLKLRSLTVSGAAVYLRLVTRDSDGLLAIPDCSVEENLRSVYSVCDFLSKRYVSSERGKITGIIINNSLDTTPEAQKGLDSLVQYIDKLALYGVVVTNAVRVNNPSADIVFPVSDNDSYSSYIPSEKNGFGSTVIEGICAYFEESYGADLIFTLMLETSLTPLEITNQSILNGIDITAGADSLRVASHNISVLTKYIKKLEDIYSSAPSSVIYYWNVDGDLSGNALACAYTYAYYKLFSENRVDGFVISFDATQEGENSLPDLLNVFKYIDTARGRADTANLLTYFGVDDWQKIIPSYSGNTIGVREHVTAKHIDILPDSVSGEYYYFDYSQATGTSPWHAGVGAKTLSINYGSSVGRALRAEFETTENSEYSYLLWSDAYPDSYKFTPYLAFNFSVEGDGGKEAGLFEVKFEIGNGSDVIECVTAVMANEESTVIFDTSAFTDKHLTDYIIIAVRPISDKNTEYSLYLSSVVGYSPEFDSEELGEAIKEVRTEIRSKGTDVEGLGADDNSVSLLISVVVVALILGVMLFFFLRHDDGEEDDE